MAYLSLYVYTLVYVVSPFTLIIPHPSSLILTLPLSRIMPSAPTACSSCCNHRPYPLGGRPYPLNRRPYPLGFPTYDTGPETC